MAIKNGNTDFTLTSLQLGPKTLSVSWYKEGLNFSGANPLIITVTRPGDFATVFTKTYSNNEYSDIFQVTVPYPGEYKVHMSTGRGYMNDYTFTMMKVTQTTSDTRTITQADVNRNKVGESIVIALGVGALGWTLARLALVSALKADKVNRFIGGLLATAGLSNIWLSNSTVTLPTPAVGDTIKTSHRNTSTGYAIDVVYTQKESGGVFKKTLDYKYLSYPR